MKARKPEILNYAISGMHCASCSSRIESVCARLPDVEKAEVSLAAESARITLSGVLPEDARDAEACAAYLAEKNAEIIARIQKLGFGAKKIPSSDDGAAGSGDPILRHFEEQSAAQAEELARRRRELIFALFFALLLLYVSMGEMLGLPLPEPLLPHHAPLGFALAQLFLCLPLLYAGRRFYFSGIPAFLRRIPNMDSLVTLGTLAAFSYSLWNTLEIALAVTGFAPRVPGGTLPGQSAALMARTMDLYYESAGVLITLISLGKYLELRSRSLTSQALRGLLDLSPEQATLLPDGIIGGESRIIPAAEVKVGDVLLVRPGERVPVDGVILEGVSSLDESMLTGESLPMDKGPGDEAAAGTFNQQGVFALRALKVGRDTVLSRIVGLVREAGFSKAPVAALADRISLHFVPVVMLIAVFSGIAWLASGAEPGTALRIFVAVLVIACPCAMGLATPISIMVGTGRGAELGVLVKSGTALEKASKLNALVLDKTGTVTTGKPVLTDLVILECGEKCSFWPDYSKLPGMERLDKSSFVLLMAGALEARSEHPLAKAVLQAATENQNKPGFKIPFPAVDNFQALPGKGIRGVFPGGLDEYLLGSPALVGESLAQAAGLPAEEALEAKQAGEECKLCLDRFASQGKTPLVLLRRRTGAPGEGYAGFIPLAVLAVADSLRPESRKVVNELKNMGLRVIMLTGDNRKTALTVAAALGIDEVLPEVLPGGKADKIRELQAQGCKVGMVGDGINDAPALAFADVGFALSNGIDIAVEAGDMVLMRGGLDNLLLALSLSRAVMRNIRQNLFWAFIYNIAGIPAAAGLLTLFGGPTLSPVLAGSAMAFSSVSVVANSLRLRFFGRK
jgi:Cu+-exporting ATPase